MYTFDMHAKDRLVIITLKPAPREYIKRIGRRYFYSIRSHNEKIQVVIACPYQTEAGISVSNTGPLLA
jgi:hypothetical protein